MRCIFAQEYIKIYIKIHTKIAATCFGILTDCSINYNFS